MRAELAAAPVEVVVANHCYGLFELAAVYLSQQPPLLDQARLAIDALGCLVDGLEGRLGEGERSLKEGLTNLRLAYVQIDGAQRAGADGRRGGRGRRRTPAAGAMPTPATTPTGERSGRRHGRAPRAGRRAAGGIDASRVRSFIGLSIGLVGPRANLAVSGVLITLFVQQRASGALAVTFALTADRLVSWLTYPVAGRLSDRTRSRVGGARRTWPAA